MSAASAAAAAAGDDPTSNRVLDRAKYVRTAAPKWDAYGHIASSETLSLLASFATNPADRKKMLDTGNIEALVALLMLYDKASGAEMVQFVTTLIDDLLEEDSERASLLLQAGTTYGQPSIEIFARKLGRCDDEYVCHQSARIVARLLLGGGDPDEATLRGYYQWLLDEIRSTDKARLLLALSCLAQSFRRPALRMAFCHIGGAVDMLWALVAVDASIQQQYQATLCLWILSFSNDAIEAMGESISACVKAVADVLNAAKKEKVVRVCVAFLRNVAECTDRSKALEMRMLMVSHRLLGTMQGLASQATYTDDELKADAEALAIHLKDTFEHMSSYDEYVTEVRSGKLEWSPVHRSERFWRENASKLNDKKHELLKLLVSYLQKSEDVTSVAVAIHDCGEYVTHYPYGRKALEELGAKTLIIDLMEHEDQTVRYEALLAVQKVMTDNWEYLGKKVKKEANVERTQ